MECGGCGRRTHDSMTQVETERFTAARFASAWRELTGNDGGAARIFALLRDRYAEPHRAYHTAQHIDECLMHLDAVRVHTVRPIEIEIALWFHDAIYDTRSPDNEQRSAEWAGKELIQAGAPRALADVVQSLVLATQHHVIPSAPDERLLVDIDLSILGAPRERFLEYDAQIRREYAWVPEEVFVRERAKVLRRFAERPSIYATDAFRASHEARARANLAAALA